MKIEAYEELPYSIKVKLKSANIFFQKTYIDFVRSNSEEVYFVYDLERIIPIRYRKKMVFKLAYFLSEPFNLGDNPLLELRDFLNQVIDILDKTLGIQWCNSTASGLFSDTPTKNCKRIPFGSHVLVLSDSEEELWSKVHSKHRNVIRRAEKNGIIIKTGGMELLNDYVSLENDTYKRTGRSSSGYAYYEKQVKNMHDNIKVYIAYDDGKPVAGGIFYFNSESAYYMYGATSQKPVTGAANLLLWNAIKDFKENGVKVLNFVGCRINEDVDSKYHGIQRFKERFGGELQTGYLFRCVKNNLLYKMFCFAMQIRMRSLKQYTTAIDDEYYKWTDIQVIGKW